MAYLNKAKQDEKRLLKVLLGVISGCLIPLCVTAFNISTASHGPDMMAFGVISSLMSGFICGSGAYIISDKW